MRKESLVDKM